MANPHQEIPNIGIDTAPQPCNQEIKRWGRPLNPLNDNAPARDGNRKLNEVLSKLSASAKETFIVVEKGGTDGLRQGSNHKRARTDEDLDGLKQLRFPYIICSKQPAPRQQDRPRNEGRSQQACERRRSLSPQRRIALSTIEHAPPEMAGKSPGKRKRKHHSKGVILLDDHSDDPLSSPTLPLQTEDSEGSYENEGEVIAAKRFKPNTGVRVKQHSGELDALSTPKDEPNAPSPENAREHPEHQDHRTTSEKHKNQWGFAGRYVAKANSLPHFAAPRNSVPVAVRPPGAKTMVGVYSPKLFKEFVNVQKAPHFGGVKPINRLSNSNHTSAPEQSKPFNLHLNHPRRAGVHPNKRQKVESTSATGDGHFNQSIDLDDSDTSQDQQRGETLGWKPRQRQAQDQNHSINNLDNIDDAREYRNVERRKPKDPKIQNLMPSHRTSGQLAKIGTRNVDSRVQGELTDSEGEDLDDPFDPISDQEISAPRSASRTTPQVVIPSTLQRSTRFEQQRPKQNRKLGRDPSAASTRSTSKYFSNDEGNPTRMHSVSSQSANDSDSVRERQQEMRRQSPGSHEHDQFGDDDDSIDDLSKADDRASFQRLPFGKRLANNGALKDQSTYILKMAKDSRPSISTKGDIQPTTFVKPRRARAEKRLEYARYDVVELFSENRIWVLRDNMGSWYFTQNRESGLIELHKNTDSANSTFQLIPNLIHRITWNSTSSKLIIFKASDKNIGDSKLFIQMKTAEHSSRLKDSLKFHVSNIGVEIMKSDVINKTFANILRRMQRNPERRVQNSKPADIQLAEQNSARRTEREMAKRQERKKVGDSGRFGGESNGDDIEAARNRMSLARAMKTGSSVDRIEVEQPEWSFKKPSIDEERFYGNSKAARTLTDFSYETRSSTRAADRINFLRQPLKARSPSPDRWTVTNPNWAQHWRSSIIFPREGKTKATVDKQDIERLDEGNFLNDNLISFYLRWLERQLEQERPDLAKRIYFYNTFFYANLTKATKGKRGINYEAVQRWTAKVDLLSFDYIIVPVNENTHWYVAIICNAPKLLVTEPYIPANSSSQDISELPKEHSNAEATAKSQQSPSSSLEQARPASSEPEVNSGMKKMTLQSKRSTDNEVDEWPDDNPGILVQPNRASPQEVLGSTMRNTEEPTVEALTAAVSEIAKAQQTPVNKQGSAKKGKKKSVAITPRKYDPTEPRIITLDSLGLKHSPTCTNLKEYLVAEIKSRRGIDIPSPGSLGMTANSIPLQDNYCDCGVFVLTYIEKFVERPDEFIHGILLSQTDVDMHWPKASDVRNKIRRILFRLQREQVKEAEDALQIESKRNRPEQFQGNAEPIPTIIPELQAESTVARSSSSDEAGSHPPDTARRLPVPETVATLIPATVPEVISTELPNVDDDSPEARGVKFGPGNEQRSDPANNCGLVTRSIPCQEQAEASVENSQTENAKSEPVTIPESPTKDVLESIHAALRRSSTDSSSLSMSSSLEEIDYRRNNVRDRKATPYPESNARSSSGEREEGSKRPSPAGDELDNSMADDSVQLISAQARPEGGNILGNDDNPSSQEMLLPNDNPQEELPHFPNVERLSSSPRSTPVREIEDDLQIMSASSAPIRRGFTSRRGRKVDGQKKGLYSGRMDGLDLALVDSHTRKKART